MKGSHLQPNPSSDQFLFAATFLAATGSFYDEILNTEQAEQQMVFVPVSRQYIDARSIVHCDNFNPMAALFQNQV